MASVRERIDADEVFFDSAIMSHGFTDYFRDYDFIVDRPGALPPELRSGSATSYITGRYCYRFTHCVESHVTTAVGWSIWGESWDDLFTDCAAWEAAGNPKGFVWGVKWADAYPGLSYVPDSALASLWSTRIGREMHEVAVETNTFEARLVCSDLRVDQIAVGDPRTGELTPLDDSVNQATSPSSIS